MIRQKYYKKVDCWNWASRRKESKFVLYVKKDWLERTYLGGWNLESNFSHVEETELDVSRDSSVYGQPLHENAGSEVNGDVEWDGIYMCEKYIWIGKAEKREYERWWHEFESMPKAKKRSRPPRIVRAGEASQKRRFWWDDFHFHFSLCEEYRGDVAQQIRRENAMQGRSIGECLVCGSVSYGW